MAVTKASGSFTQGWFAYLYSDAQWAQEFANMKAAGIQQLIVQTTVDESSTGAALSYTPTKMLSLYPSKIANITYYGNTPGTSVSTVESILKHAEANGVSVYLGLNSYPAAWVYESTTRPFVTDTTWGGLEAARGNLIATELATLYKTKYPKAFAGWYWPWEIDNTQPLLYPATIAALAKTMNATFSHLATISGGMPVMISPFFNSGLGTAAQYASFWKSLFGELVDFGANGIFAPQDGIGAGNTKLTDLTPWFDALQGAVATKPGLKFWANCETFVSGSPNTSAPLSRVIQQFQAVGSSVSDIVTFSYSYYDSPLRVSPTYQAEWVAYYNTGKLAARFSLCSVDVIAIRRVVHTK